MGLEATPKRVLIIGSPGAGKSTFAVNYAAERGLPLVHLDQEYFLPGWKKRFTREEWVRHVDSLLEQPCWVLDGNHRSTLLQRIEKADMVIWLQIPMWKALWRVGKRTLLPHTHTGRADGCGPRVGRSLIKSIMYYQRWSVPLIEEAMDRFGRDKFHIIRM